MKKLQQLAARGGYSRYSYGTVPTSKLQTLLYKFEDRYRINATKQQRYRAKKKGEANTEIVLFMDKNDKTKIHFWLMVSAGFGSVNDMEELHELTDKKHRLVVTGYELVRVQRTEKARWTWRLTKETYGEFEQRVINACRHKNMDHIAQIHYSLKTMPVFSAMRQQSFALFKTLKNEWKRSIKGEFPFPDLQKNFYGRYKAAKTLSASDLSRKAMKRVHEDEKRDRELLSADLRDKIAACEKKLRELDSIRYRELNEIYYQNQLDRSMTLNELENYQKQLKAL